MPTAQAPTTMPRSATGATISIPLMDTWTCWLMFIVPPPHPANITLATMPPMIQVAHKLPGMS